jgi:hypothetical protein
MALPVECPLGSPGGWAGKIIEHGFKRMNYHKIKILFINKEFTCFFMSIDSASKSSIVFQKINKNHNG